MLNQINEMKKTIEALVNEFTNQADRADEILTDYDIEYRSADELKHLRQAEKQEVEDRYAELYDEFTTAVYKLRSAKGVLAALRVLEDEVIIAQNKGILPKG